MGEHNLTLQRIIFIWLKYLNCPEQAVSIRRLKSSLPVSNPLVPHDHHRQWSWSPCLSPYRLYSWYSFITFFFLSLSSSNLLLSPFLLCCVSCVSLPLLFPSFPLPCCGVLWLSLFHWGGDTPTPIPIYHVRPGADTVRKPLGPWKVSDLDILVDPLPTSPPEARSGGSDGMSRECGRLRRCSP